MYMLKLRISCISLYSVAYEGVATSGIFGTLRLEFFIQTQWNLEFFILNKWNLWDTFLASGYPLDGICVYR